MDNVFWISVAVAAYLVIGHATWDYVKEQAAKDYNRAQVALMYVVAVVFWLPIFVILLLRGRNM